MFFYANVSLEGDLKVQFGGKGLENGGKCGG